MLRPRAGSRLCASSSSSSALSRRSGDFPTNRKTPARRQPAGFFLSDPPWLAHQPKERTPTMQFTGAELITRLIERQGVTTLAGVPGGMCLPLYDALARSRIRHVLARHEQAAGFIAQGMAR